MKTFNRPTTRVTDQKLEAELLQKIVYFARILLHANAVSFILNDEHYC